MREIDEHGRLQERMKHCEEVFDEWVQSKDELMQKFIDSLAVRRQFLDESQHYHLKSRKRVLPIG